MFKISTTTASLLLACFALAACRDDRDLANQKNFLALKAAHEESLLSGKIVPRTDFYGVYRKNPGGSFFLKQSTSIKRYVDAKNNLIYAITPTRVIVEEYEVDFNTNPSTIIGYGDQTVRYKNGRMFDFEFKRVSKTGYVHKEEDGPREFESYGLSNDIETAKQIGCAYDKDFRRNFC